MPPPPRVTAGTRNLTAARVAGAMRRWGLSARAIEEVRRMATSIARYLPTGAHAGGVPEKVEGATPPDGPPVATLEELAAGFPRHLLIADPDSKRSTSTELAVAACVAYHVRAYCCDEGGG